MSLLVESRLRDVRPDRPEYRNRRGREDVGFCYHEQRTRVPGEVDSRDFEHAALDELRDEEIAVRRDEEDPLGLFFGELGDRDDLARVGRRDRDDLRRLALQADDQVTSEATERQP